MKNRQLHRIACATLLVLAVALPGAAPAAATPARPATPGLHGTWTWGSNLLSNLWDGLRARLVSLGSFRTVATKEGGMIDPNGGPKEGISVDPNGGPHTGSVSTGTMVDEGGMIDPDGRK